MKVIVSDCSAIYTGRGDTLLPRAVRALIIKEDGSVSIHNDKSNKPLNYMKAAQLTESVNDEGEAVWTFDARHESLAITLHSIITESSAKLVEEDPGLVRDGTESHLQEWLSRHPEVLCEGYTFVQREYATGKGPVDILARDAEGNPVAVEVKRVAMLGAVDQCRRYRDALTSQDESILDTLENDATEDNAAKHNEHNLDFSRTTVMIAAVDIRPKTLEWAKKHNVTPVWIPKDWRNIP